MECKHEWKMIEEIDYGEMDYSSYGGGVEHFIVTLYRCSICGLLKKEARGDFNGDPSEFLEISEDDYARFERE